MAKLVKGGAVRARARAGAVQLVGVRRARSWRAAALATAALGRRGSSEARSVPVLARAGLIDLDPLRAAAELRAIALYGQLGAPVVLAAIRHGDRIGLIDELGSLSFRELHDRSSALAAALHRRGVSGADTVGILCANHRGFLDSSFAAAKLGARIVYLDPAAGQDQLHDLVRTERVTLLVHDEQHTALVEDLSLTHGRLVAWHASSRAESDAASLDELIRLGAELRPAPPPARPSSAVLLTAGTTGPPKRARHGGARGIAPVGALLSRVPYRAGEAMYLAAPMLHGVGYFQMLTSLALGATLIVERRFDPERVVAAITAHEPTALVLAPVMLREVLAVLERSLNLYDLSSLRIVAAAGATLDPELVRRTQASIGRVLYNLYGTTELGYLSVATPDDLAAAPGCAGRPVLGVLLRRFDEDGEPLAGVDRPGRIFASSSARFDGYSGGRAGEVIDGLLGTGDLGHVDVAGRLWVDGREGELVISGAGTVFPTEVEAALITHPGVAQTAVLRCGGERDDAHLVACVVLEPDHQVGAEQIRKFLAASLPTFKVPREVLFLTELPRNLSGAVRIGALRELVGELAGS